MIIKTQFGLGDCLYLRPVIKHLPFNNMYLETSWPQAFSDLPVKFIKPSGYNLRTQKDNVDSVDPKLWSERPKCPVSEYTLSYNLDTGSITHNYCSILLGKQPRWFDNTLNLNLEWGIKAKRWLEKYGWDGKKPICLIRQNTLRTEWTCPARNPIDDYLQQFVDKYKDKFCFVSIANLKDNEEWLTYDIQNMDIKVTKGVPLTTLFGLFFCADIVVTSPSFWVPLGLALNTNMVVVYGAHEPHFRINDIRIKQNNCTIIEPEPFDLCDKDKLDAYKYIKSERLEKAFEEGVSKCLG